MLLQSIATASLWTHKGNRKRSPVTYSSRWSLDRCIEEGDHAVRASATRRRAQLLDALGVPRDVVAELDRKLRRERLRMRSAFIGRYAVVCGVAGLIGKALVALVA